MENNIKEIVINYHINTPCNYQCYFCYADWGIKKKELHYNLSEVKNLLEKIRDYFESRFSKIRLNLAGGEPLLVKNLDKIIDYSIRLGFDCSIITNGSLLTENFIQKHARNFKVFGVSVDSTDYKILQKIGRQTRKGEQLDFQKLIDYLNLLRSLNPRILIKINTVVNQFNFSDESLKNFLNEVKPDKWKVLRILPNIKTEAGISNEQWEMFLKNHQNFSDIWTVEDNKDMRASYLMIDPLGRFFDNSKEIDHNYSDPIIEVGIEKAFNQISFDLSKFQARYPEFNKKESHEK